MRCAAGDKEVLGDGKFESRVTGIRELEAVAFPTGSFGLWGLPEPKAGAEIGSLRVFLVGSSWGIFPAAREFLVERATVTVLFTDGVLVGFRVRVLLVAGLGLVAVSAILSETGYV